MTEFYDPRIDGLRDAPNLAAWLVAHNATLDTDIAGGFAAGSLAVEDPDRGGKWILPLKSVIDFVDIDDKRFATKYPADIHVTDMDNERLSEIEVLYTGTDDQLRRARVDQDAEISFVATNPTPNS